MLFWDEYFGWDFYAMRQAAFGLLSFGTLVSLVAMTEGYTWYAPYAAILRFFADHAPQTLILSMLGLSAGFWYWRMKVV
jgi:hypothetical protein